jgi:hypothetical protein
VGKVTKGGQGNSRAESEPVPEPAFTAFQIPARGEAEYQHRVEAGDIEHLAGFRARSKA